MIFPVYCVLLDFSGVGANTAISKIIAETPDNHASLTVLKGSIRLFVLFGGACTLLMIMLSKTISSLQGNVNAWMGYIMLAPSVLLVTIISCYRGYFQGKMNMLPTSISQIIEQIIKLIFGLIFVGGLMPNVTNAVAGATLAVTLSEFVALVYLYATFKYSTKDLPLTSKFDTKLFKSQLKKLLKTTLMVTLIGVTLPISHVIDSFLIINLLSTYRTDATSLFGLFSGTATTIINLPISLCYGIATATIPAISKIKDRETQTKTATKSIYLTLLLSIPLSLICLIFSPLIVKILFGGLGVSERITTVNLIRFLSVNVISLSLLQTTNGVLIGKGNLKTPLISMLIGVSVKIILNLALLPNPKFNIYGSVIGAIACYFSAVMINLIKIFNLRVANASKNAKTWQLNH